MTEITEKTLINWPDARRRTIDLRAFIFAASLTPFVFAITGVIGLIYGVVVTAAAAIMGFPAYLMFGLPGAYLALTRISDGSKGGDFGALFIMGILANAGSFVLAYFYQLSEGGRYADPVEDALLYAGLGLIAGPIQALIFGMMYRSWARPDACSTSNPQQHEGEMQCA